MHWAGTLCGTVCQQLYQFFAGCLGFRPKTERRIVRCVDEKNLVNSMSWWQCMPGSLTHWSSATHLRYCRRYVAPKANVAGARRLACYLQIPETPCTKRGGRCSILECSSMPSTIPKPWNNRRYLGGRVRRLTWLVQCRALLSLALAQAALGVNYVAQMHFPSHAARGILTHAAGVIEEACSIFFKQPVRCRQM
jgi:hypothetical protein